MIKFILVYLFFGSCMFAATCRVAYNPHWLAALFVSLFWPWFLFASIFERIIK